MILSVRSAVSFVIGIAAFLGIYWLGGGEFERGPALADAVVGGGIVGCISAVITLVRQIDVLKRNGVPEGWKLMPVEPTPEMVAAGNAAEYSATTHQPARVIYQRMLAAAPEVKP
jgi:hypothetical protein